jgi:hypothetical protein
MIGYSLHAKLTGEPATGGGRTKIGRTGGKFRQFEFIDFRIHRFSKFIERTFLFSTGPIHGFGHLMAHDVDHELSRLTDVRQCGFHLVCPCLRRPREGEKPSTGGITRTTLKRKMEQV